MAGSFMPSRAAVAALHVADEVLAEALVAQGESHVLVARDQPETLRRLEDGRRLAQAAVERIRVGDEGRIERIELERRAVHDGRGHVVHGHFLSTNPVAARTSVLRIQTPLPREGERLGERGCTSCRCPLTQPRRKNVSSRTDGALASGMFALTQGLRRAVQTKPNGISTHFAGRRRTWQQTIDRVSRIAGALFALGVRPGDRVAILALNSDRYFELMYAIPWIGAAMVPINTRLAAPEIEYILSELGRRGIVHRHRHVAPPDAARGQDARRARGRLARRHVGPGRPAAFRGSHQLRSGARCRRGQRRPGGSLLYRRHHGTLQGRDAHPHQPGGERAERRGRHRLHRRYDLHPFRADVPPRRRRLDLRRHHGRRPPRLRAALRAGRGAADHPDREGDARAVRADHDQHDRQPSALRRVRHHARSPSSSTAPRRCPRACCAGPCR